MTSFHAEEPGNGADPYDLRALSLDPRAAAYNATSVLEAGCKAILETARRLTPHVDCTSDAFLPCLRTALDRLELENE